MKKEVLFEQLFNALDRDIDEAINDEEKSLFLMKVGNWLEAKRKEFEKDVKLKIFSNEQIYEN